MKGNAGKGMPWIHMVVEWWAGSVAACYINIPIVSLL